MILSGTNTGAQIADMFTGVPDRDRSAHIAIQKKSKKSKYLFRTYPDSGGSKKGALGDRYQEIESIITLI